MNPVKLRPSESRGGGGIDKKWWQSLHCRFDGFMMSSPAQCRHFDDIITHTAHYNSLQLRGLAVKVNWSWAKTHCIAIIQSPIFICTFKFKTGSWSGNLPLRVCRVIVTTVCVVTAEQNMLEFIQNKTILCWSHALWQLVNCDRSYTMVTGLMAFTYTCVNIANSTVRVGWLEASCDGSHMAKTRIHEGSIYVRVLKDDIFSFIGPYELHSDQSWILKVKSLYCTHAQFNIIEAHCYALQCRRIDCEQLCSSINQQLIAGCFSHKGLHQLRTKQRPSWPKRPAISCWLILLRNCSQSIRLHAQSNLASACSDACQCELCALCIDRSTSYVYVLLVLIHCVFQLIHLELHAYRYTQVRTRTAMEVLAQRIL